MLYRLPSVIYAKCHKYALHTECHYDQCHSAQYRYSEYLGAQKALGADSTKMLQAHL